MRDFRVTTVFEGTTEIHSMYPAMFLVRKWTGAIQRAGLSPWKRALFLLKACLPKRGPRLEFGDGVLPGAHRFVRGSIGAVNRLLAMGLMVHGRKLIEKQFLLRRITTVSLYAYAVIGLLAGVEGERRAGQKGTPVSDLMRYFLLEAKETSRRTRRILPDRRETLHRRIFSRMKQEI
jgi:acyl-CoA dehydrogenase family member 9